MSNQILTKESAESLNDIIEDFKRAKDSLRNLRVLTIGGVYGAVLSVSIQFILSPLLFPSSKDTNELILIGLFLAFMATVIFNEQYRKLYPYGARFRSFALTFKKKKDYKKNKEKLLEKLKDVFGDKLQIVPFNEEGGGYKEDILYINDKEKDKSSGKLTYMPELSTIEIRLNLENKYTEKLLKIFEAIEGKDNSKGYKLNMLGVAGI